MIRYEILEKIDYHPATFEFVEERREVVACKKACDNSIIMAKVPKRMLPKVPVTDSLLAHIIVSKCDDRQPLNHLQETHRKKYAHHILQKDAIEKSSDAPDRQAFFPMWVHV